MPDDDEGGSGDRPAPEPAKWLYCPKCSFSTTSPGDLKAHIQAAHS